MSVIDVESSLAKTMRYFHSVCIVFIGVVVGCVVWALYMSWCLLLNVTKLKENICVFNPAEQSFSAFELLIGAESDQKVRLRVAACREGVINDSSTCHQASDVVTAIQAAVSSSASCHLGIGLLPHLSSHKSVKPKVLMGNTWKDLGLQQ